MSRSLLAVDQYDMSTLKVLLSGAAPLGAALTKQVKAFPRVEKVVPFS